MKQLSHLIAELQGVLEDRGDMKVFTKDMEQVELEISEPGPLPEEEDDPLRGQICLCIGKGDV